MSKPSRPGSGGSSPPGRPALPNGLDRSAAGKPSLEASKAGSSGDRSADPGAVSAAASAAAPSGTPDPAGRSGRGASSPHLWVASTYFAEGFPYAIVNSLPEVLFKEAGASLKAIGLTALFHLPWNIKFLWGPFIDAFSTRRAWLVWIEVLLTAGLIGLAFVASWKTVLVATSVLFLLVALLSATHDIAIDGYYLEGLDREDQSKFVGYRASAYRIAMWVVSGGLLVLIGQVGWTVGFLACAAIMGLLLAYHATFLPRLEPARRPFSELARGLFTLRALLVVGALVLGIAGIRALFDTGPVQAGIDAALTAVPTLAKVGLSGWIAIAFLTVLLLTLAALTRIRAWLETKDSFYAEAFIDFLSQPKVGRILAFIILFRAGDSFLLKMRYSFLRDAGMSMEQFGVAGGTFGLFASFTATLIGGFLLARGGLQRWIWPFVVLQNVLNLLYMALAWHRDTLLQAGVSTVALPLLTGVVTLEAFGSGFGTAVFMVYIMRCCRPAYKAAHMAILTALMSLSFTLAGVVSGFLAEWLGYTLYFGFTFLATIPSMILILFIPYLDGTSAADLAPLPAREPAS